MHLDDDVIRLAKAPNLATVVTLMPDGTPQAQLVWVDTDGTHLLVNTEPQRQRYRNLQRDPRVTVLIHSREDPYDWAEVRGHLDGEVRGEPAHEHINELSRRYTGRDYGSPIGPHGRVLLRIAADRVLTPARLREQLERRRAS